MKKDRFYKLLENPSQASSVDIKALEKIIESSPYFSAARTLHAKIQIERKNITALDELDKRGSFYPNSLILTDWEEEIIPKEEESSEPASPKVDVTKEIIEALPKPAKSVPLGQEEGAEVEKAPSTEEAPNTTKETESVFEKVQEETSEKPSSIEIDQEIEAEVKESKEEENVVAPPEETHKEEVGSADGIVDQVMENMLALRKTISEMKAKEEGMAKKPTHKKPATKKSTVAKKKTASKKPSSKPASQKTKATASKGASKKKAEKPEKSSIAKTDKEKEKKLEKQRTLIKDFIKNPPDLKQEYKGDGGPNEDLATVSTSENRLLVSESLAKILTRQGKHQKAKEVYEQLMLKYPKKKSYFAAQIKSLKV